MMNMIYEVYSGPRLLQAEQVTSRPVTCSKGILAGCPAAIDPCASAGPFKEQFPRASIDVRVACMGLMCYNKG